MTAILWSVKDWKDIEKWSPVGISYILDLCAFLSKQANSTNACQCVVSCRMFTTRAISWGRYYNWIIFLFADLVWYFSLNSIETSIEIINCDSQEDSVSSIHTKPSFPEINGPLYHGVDSSLMPVINMPFCQRVNRPLRKEIDGDSKQWDKELNRFSIYQGHVVSWSRHPLMWGLCYHY